MGPQQYSWGARQNPPQPEVLPSEAQRAALEASASLVGMGRVNEFSDAGDGAVPCTAALDADVGRRQDDYVSRECHYTACIPYVQPFYFNWAAASVTR